MTCDGRSADDAGDRIVTFAIDAPDSGRFDAFLNDLRSLAKGAPPTPSAALAAMLDGAAPPSVPTPRARRHRKTIAGAVLMGSIGTGLSGAAAAEQPRPGPVQHIHTHVIPESAPAQGAPVGGQAPARAAGGPQPQRPGLDPARPAPHVLPTTRPQPTHPSNPAPSGRDRRASERAVHGDDSEHDETPSPDRTDQP